MSTLNHRRLEGSLFHNDVITTSLPLSQADFHIEYTVFGRRESFYQARHILRNVFVNSLDSILITYAALQRYQRRIFTTMAAQGLSSIGDPVYHNWPT